MPLGLLYGLGAALMWGLTDVGASIAGRRLGSLRVLAATQVLGFAALVLVAIALGRGSTSDPRVILIATLVGLAGTGAYLSFFTALRIGPLSVVSPITAAYGGLTVVLAVIFRGETLSPFQILGATVATAGVVLAGLTFDDAGDGDGRRVRVVGKGVAFAIVALVLFAVMTVGMAGPIQEVGWVEAVLPSRAANVVASVVLLAVGLALAPRFLAPMLQTAATPIPRAWAIAGIAGLLDVIGLFSFAIGLERAETWLVGLASSFGPAVAVLVGVGFLGERLRPTQWLGLSGIAVGLGAVALG